MPRRLAFHEAARAGNALRVAECLGKEPIPPDVLNRDGLTALNLACQHGHSKVAKVLLDAGADVNLGCGRFQVTPLLVAWTKKHYDLVGDLVAVGGDVSMPNADGVTPLIMASSEGDWEGVHLLIQLGADLNSQDNKGATALCHAIWGPNEVAGTDIAKILLESGADCSIAARDGRNPIISAVLNGNCDLVRVLLDAGANISDTHAGMTPLLFAVREGHAEIVRELLKAGANITAMVRGFSALMIAIKEGDEEVVRNLCEAKANLGPIMRGPMKGTTPLWMAAAHGHVGAVRELLKAGADTTERYDGCTPLLVAASGGHTDIVRCLCEAKANTDAMTLLGRTPLMVAALDGHAGVTLELLKAGADVEVTGKDGETALHLAAFEGSFEVVRSLVTYGADVNKGPLHGKPLMMASQEGHLGLVRYFIRAGADVSAGDEGRTPLLVASREGHANVMRELIRFGAKPLEGDSLSWTMLHFAACSVQLDAAKALLEGGYLETNTDMNGLTAISVVGMSPDEEKPTKKRDLEQEACMRRLLARGPAFRARSWLWSCAPAVETGVVCISHAPGVGDDTKHGPRQMQKPDFGADWLHRLKNGRPLGVMKLLCRQVVTVYVVPFLPRFSEHVIWCLPRSNSEQAMY